MIRVVLASRLTVVREGMKRILLPEDDIKVVAEVTRVQEAVAVEAALQPQVVVVAHPLDTDGDDYLCFLQEKCPSLQIVIVASSPTVSLVLAALRKGVRGLLSTRCSAAHLTAAIRAVSAGNIYMHEEVSSLVAQDLGMIDRDYTHRSLTQREMEIFVKLADGMKVTAIALELGISAKTVSTHKTRILEKMGMRSLSQLVQYAVANRLFYNTASC